MDHLTDAGVGIQRLEVFEHPTDAHLNAVVLLTHPTPERALRNALPLLESLPTVVGQVTTLRLADLG